MMLILESVSSMLQYLILYGVDLIKTMTTMFYCLQIKDLYIEVETEATTGKSKVIISTNKQCNNYKTRLEK